MFAMFYIFYKSRKNIPPEKAIQECVYYTLFSVHSLLLNIVSVTWTKFLYMDMTIALTLWNEIQQTVSIRLTIITWYYSYIRYFLSNVLLYKGVISLDHGLPNDLYKMRFVDFNLLKPNYISHIMKCVSFSEDKALLCNSQIHYVTLE